MPYLYCTITNDISALTLIQKFSSHCKNLEHRQPAEVSSSEQIFNRPAADLMKTVFESTLLATTTAAVDLQRQSLLFGD
jgi:hypothetical protein